MKVESIKRVFEIDGKPYDDPNPTMSIKEVKAFYATQHPELVNSELMGPTYENGVAKYSASKSIGTKG